MTVKELLDRNPPNSGTKVMNCLTHSNKSISNRPSNCELCQTDIKNWISWAIAINDWLNQWKEDATKLLTP